VPTRLGWAFLSLAGGIGFAALNTGNNLLYLLIGICLATMAVSFVAGGRALSLLRAEVTFPEEILAADPTALILTLHNPSSHRHSAAASARLRAGGQRLPGVRFGSLAPGGSATRFVPTRFPWRGLVRGVRLALETTDPFGLVRRRRHLRIRGEFFVYPAPSPPGEVDDLGRHGRGDLPARRIGEGIELHQIRRYQLEDESRHLRPGRRDAERADPLEVRAAGLPGHRPGDPML